MNLSKQNILINDLKNGVLDLTFKINGPIISQIARVFKEDWEFATGKKFQPLFTKDFPIVNNNINPARIIPDGPDTKKKIIEPIAHGAINAAIKKILILTPYFLPENNILTAIEMAAMKGVNVEIIIPNKNKPRFINWAVEPNFLRLIKNDVKIYRSPEPFDHSKMFVVDDEWIFIGSANWDVRSFKLNFESNMEIFSKDLAKELTAIFECKKKKSKLTTAFECENLPLLKRLRNNVYRLLTPYG
jgi:cardiolipin synthase